MDQRPDPNKHSDPRAGHPVDRLFTVRSGERFTFDQQVAEVFDDMVARSIPFYDEQQRMVVELAKRVFVRGSTVYDVGCSTGTTQRPWFQQCTVSPVPAQSLPRTMTWSRRPNSHLYRLSVVMAAKNNNNNTTHSQNCRIHFVFRGFL